MNKNHQNDYEKGRIVIVDTKKAKILKEYSWDIVVAFQQDGQYKWSSTQFISKTKAESLHARKQTQRNSN